MEQEGSVQHWQQHTTLPDSNQCHPVHGPSPYFFQNHLILSSSLRMDLLRGLFASRFPIKLVFAFLISHTCYMIGSSHTPWHLISTSGTQYEAWSFLLQSYLHISLLTGPKYSSHRPVLKTRSVCPTFFPCIRYQIKQVKLQLYLNIYGLR